MAFCYRDMTFCSAECSTYDCHRQFTSEEQEKANEWMENPPIAFSDFSKNCDLYRPIQVDFEAD